MEFRNPVTVAICGCGSRGRDAYAPCVEKYPDKMKITAVADLDPQKCAFMAERYGVPAEHCYASADELLSQPRLADMMIISTMDGTHREYAIRAMEKGYNLLLEKPIAATQEDCLAVQEAARRLNRTVVVCHVLRYTPFYQAVKRIIESGKIGKVMAVNAMENIGYYHFAHSFVRGNWRNLETSAPLVLAKCCHDLDLLLWLTGKHCKAVSSVGGLSLFREEAAPAGAGLRCLDGTCSCKAECPYDAEKIYLDRVRAGNTGWPTNVFLMNATEETLTEALQTSPYGRCVYHCDNDVCDHQEVTLELEDGVTASLTISAFSDRIFRKLRIMGTLGELEGNMEDNILRVCRFGEQPEEIDVRTYGSSRGGHGGGDVAMVGQVLELMNAEKQGLHYENPDITGLDCSVESHLCCFAAEKSRLSGGIPVNPQEGL